MTATKKDAAFGEPIAWENPLIPNKRLRALYRSMVELRLLQEHLGKRQRSRVTTVRGEEGCRVSTTFDLKAGDLTSDFTGDGAVATATSFLRGAILANVIDRAYQSGTVSESNLPGQLPVIAKAADRLHLAMGAAVVLKTTRKGALVIGYLHRDEVALTEWKPMLRFAAEQVLPMIFVVLPVSGMKGGKPGQLSLLSSKCGVPGIPVDAADPVALYRVAQESMLRARAGGGPVLMECIAFQIAGKKAQPTNPIATMREFLLLRKIVDETWFGEVETRFMAHLKVTGR